MSKGAKVGKVPVVHMARDLSDEPTRVEGYPYRGGPVLDIEHSASVPPGPPAPPPRRRGLWPWVLALLVLVLVGLGAVYAFAHRAGPSTERGPRFTAPTTSTLAPTATTTLRHVLRTH